MSDWRFLVCRPDGKGNETLITSDLPAESVDVTVSLSAPGYIKLTLPIHFAHLTEPDGNPVFREWGTTIYAERDGIIMGGGIVDEVDSQGPKLNVSAVGFVGYLQDMPFTDVYGAYDADPTDIARFIWTHVQKQPGGNLGLAVDAAKSGRKIGTRGLAAFRGRPAIKDDKGNVVTAAIPPRAEVQDEPFLLAWYQTANLLDDFNKLSQVTPFDYAERHYWQGSRIAHTLDMAYPTMGRERKDLRFIIGENIVEAPRIYSSEYASELLFLGAGEGSAKVRATASQTAPDRLRRVKVVSDPGVPANSLAKRMADTEVKFYTGKPTVGDMTVVDHPNAPIGAFEVGDTIFVQGSNAWFGSADMWVRISRISYKPGQNEVATLSVVVEGE